jgi:hypothetical protein
MPVGFDGICGPSGRPCKLVWSSFYPSKVGTYPSDLLPSKRTIWHATDAGGYDFTAPITGRGGEGLGGAAILGGGILGGLSGSGLFGSDIQFDTFQAQSHIAIIFAKTINRINASHIITQEEIDSIDPETGIGTINVGEYIFEAVAVTDQKVEINQTLTPTEIQELAESGETPSDRIFRKIFEQGIPAERNRLKNIQLNKLGIEYRLDNGDPKSSVMFDLPGGGDLHNPSYRDGSSKILEVDLKMVIPPTDSTESDPGYPNGVTVGNVIYLTYVAVKEHYIRQVVNIKHTFFAIALPPECLQLQFSVKAANYRFYEWEVPSDNPNDPPTMLSGWRAVESFSVPVNVSSLVTPIETPDLAFFYYGPQSGISLIPYMPGNTTSSGITGYQNNRSSMPKFEVNISGVIENAKYEPYRIVSDDYEQSNWYTTRMPSTMYKYSDVIRHVYFNTHPKAMHKRDVDKFGFEKSLATAILNETKSGRSTLFPFRDDIRMDDPTNSPVEDLSASNLYFSPIQTPSSAWGADMQCAVAGSAVLGKKYSPNGDVLGYFHIESPLITETFDKDTRVLVERHFTFGGQGPQIVSIEGQAGVFQYVTAAEDPGRNFSLSYLTNNDGFIVFHKFNNSSISNDFSKMMFRPDYNPPVVEDNNDPVPSQFDVQLGYSGMLGDIPGFYPGRMLSFSAFMPVNYVKYKVFGDVDIPNKQSLSEDQIEEITTKREEGKYIIEIGSGYYQNTEISYTCSEKIPTLVNVVLRNGDTIVGVIDSVSINPVEIKMIINHGWMQAETIEINSIPSSMNIHGVLVSSVKDAYAVDFLNYNDSSASDDIEKNAIDRLNGRGIFLKSQVASAGSDDAGRMFLFFDDDDGGISCAQSDNCGIAWYIQYGIVEKIADSPAHYPFVIQNVKTNYTYIFFLFNGNIMCKKIPYDSFEFGDNMLVQRYEQDVLVGNLDEDTSISENASVYSFSGNNTRRSTLSFLVAGDRNEPETLRLSGKKGDSIDPFIEKSVGNNVEIVRKYPISIGQTTAFVNNSIEDAYFSAYRTNDGVMRTFFLAPTSDDAGGGNQLQCNFSSNDGSDWYYLWEYIQYRRNRQRFDVNNKSSFIDFNSSGSSETPIGSDPQSQNQNAPFGINVHWSRLKRHKIPDDAGDITLDSESQILEVYSPYVFYQKSTGNLFIFYVYENCLLCKIVSDSIFEIPSTSDSENSNAFGYVKKIIERDTKSYFVDGNLDQSAIHEELQGYINKDTNERMASGNIIFQQQYGMGAFTSDRNISPQRMCAVDLPNGGLRLFYKINSRIKSAIWNGKGWMAEEFLKSQENLPEIDFEVPTGAIDVWGGFGGDSFPPP